MKGEKNPLQITHISLEDFKKLNLKGYKYGKHYYKQEQEELEDGSNAYLAPEEVTHEETGEYVTDSKGGIHWITYPGISSKMQWDEVSLNKIVEENIEFSKEMGWTGPICVALHNEPSYCGDLYADLYNNSYCDKWTTRGDMRTYLTRCDVAHLYSKRNYFYTMDDFFQVDKRETKAVYLIYWN